MYNYTNADFQYGRGPVILNRVLLALLLALVVILVCGTAVGLVNGKNRQGTQYRRADPSMFDIKGSWTAANPTRNLTPTPSWGKSARSQRQKKAKQAAYYWLFRPGSPTSRATPRSLRNWRRRTGRKNP